MQSIGNKVRCRNVRKPGKGQFCMDRRITSGNDDLERVRQK
jgi:hypothetical protein